MILCLNKVTRIDNIIIFFQDVHVSEELVKRGLATFSKDYKTVNKQQKYENERQIHPLDPPENGSFVLQLLIRGSKRVSFPFT